MDIVCLGEMVIDLFPAELGRRLVEVSAFHPKPGGAPANVAVAAARLGAHTAFIGKVGDDAFGHQLRATLTEEGVDTRGMRLDAEARTTLAFIAMPDAHSAEFVFYRNPGADMRLRPAELDLAMLRQTRILHVGSVSLSAEPVRQATLAAVATAKAAGALISFDVNYRPSLWAQPDQARDLILELLGQADLVKVNETELALLTGSTALATGSQAILARGPALCVVTLGAQGSYFGLAGGGEMVPGFTVPTVDAVGCGDAFTAGLLRQLAASERWTEQLTPPTLRQMLRYANAVGALTAQKQGVIPALPTADEVERFLSQQPLSSEKS